MSARLESQVAFAMRGLAVGRVSRRRLPGGAGQIAAGGSGV
jgi:hypothetical protein